MKGKNLIISCIPITVGTVLAYTVLFAGRGMENSWWISIVVALIGVVGTLISVFLQLRRDGKSIDRIDSRSVHIPNIDDNTKKSKDILVESLKPNIEYLKNKSDKIDYIAKEVEYQQRVKNSISGNISGNKDILLQGINLLYESNASLNQSLAEARAKCSMLEMENANLKNEIADLNRKLYNGKRQNRT